MGWGRNFDIFNRLYRVSDQHDRKISEMGTWGVDEWVWDLKWKRNLRAREEPNLNNLL